MAEFQGKRVSHEYVQANNALPEEVFPLLCPVREADWAPDWRYRIIYSKSGLAEAGCVFMTPNEDSSETTWMVTDFDPTAFCIGFAWMNPGLVTAQIRIVLTRNARGTTSAHISYTYTGLSPAGNREVERYDEQWFRHKMRSWETAINHYLRTGKKIDASAWE